MLTENVSYFYDFSIDNRKDVRYNTNIHTEYMFGIFVWNICIARIIYNIIKYGGVFMQEMSIRTTAQIYNFSELQKKKHERELREKRPFFITGIIIFISLLTICCFLYFSNYYIFCLVYYSMIFFLLPALFTNDSNDHIVLQVNSYIQQNSDCKTLFL